MARAKDVEATRDMEDGWPQLDSKFWDQEGALKKGISKGGIRNVAKRGATIALASREETAFPAPVQTQIVVDIKDGVLIEKVRLVRNGLQIIIHRYGTGETHTLECSYRFF